MESTFQPPSTTRRYLVLSGSALAATAWVAPSVIGIDRVAAAVGTCGAPQLQIDWSAYAGTYPSSITANDGTTVSITVNDPFGVGDPGFLGLVFNGTTSTLDNPLIMAMDNATNGDYTELIFSFSQPVAPCFSMLDVDFGNFSTGWEDTVVFNGTLGGTAVPLGVGDITTYPGNAFAGTNTVVGTANVPNSSTDAQIDVSFPSAIDQLSIRHLDNSAFTGFQYVGIHDFSWC